MKTLVAAVLILAASFAHAKEDVRITAAKQTAARLFGGNVRGLFMVAESRGSVVCGEAGKGGQFRQFYVLVGQEAGVIKGGNAAMDDLVETVCSGLP